ncbi:hypothetical protein ACFO8Q_19600 [Effusibacillus consociatus]|uniref:Uncharacterized protein n=1 Tax=Effusibacillus consociatus TaxID=1117041 RepID=A0ABV9Q6S4_9BACL
MSEESLYAGLTREETRKFGRIDANMQSDFLTGYDVSARPIWFTPGMFVESIEESDTLLKTDRVKYNVVDEIVPSTSKSTVFDKKGNRNFIDRNNIATFGSIESVLPNQKVFTIGISKEERFLSCYAPQDVYLMGKKRTMFEVLGVSDVVRLQEDELQETIPTQVQMEDLNEYFSYTIHDVNARYFLVQGKALKCWRVHFYLDGKSITRFLPGVFVERAERYFGGSS